MLPVQTADGPAYRRVLFTLPISALKVTGIIVSGTPARSEHSETKKLSSISALLP
jgi:hypothetical protein